MTMFIDLKQGLDSLGNPLEPQVWLNLYTISREDGNFGEVSLPGDTTVVQVQYKEAAPTPPTAARLYELANTNFDFPIVITGLAGGTDPYSGLDITGNGLTYVDSTGSTFAGGVVRVVYDLNQCNGAGIVAFDIAGHRITTPNPVLLYHELSHAFRAARQETDPVNDEIPAEKDENVMRDALGLCLRDVNNHGGDCGPPADDCGGSDGNPGGCFIVSATTGSSDSAEVTSLRQLRDRVSGISGLAAQLIDVIYREYYQFSPGIAAELERDALARQAMLWIVVRPLLAWYTLAGMLALDQADQKEVNQAAQDVLSACPRYLGGSSIASLLETLRSEKPLPTDAPQLLLGFAPRIQEAARLRFASWAILDPLVRAWTSVTRHLDVVDEVSQWLATAPLEALAPPSDPERLDQELRALASFFDFRPTARQQLGERLAGAWPDATATLARHGFV